MKIVEIEAQSVDKEKAITIETKFLSKHQDISTAHISFPYAIYVDTPMRYRVTEIDINGESRIMEWKDKIECSSIIDVTTRAKEQNLESKNIEVEMDEAFFSADSLSTVKVMFSYIFNESLKTKEVIYNQKEATAIKKVKLIHDKTKTVSYRIQKISEDGKSLTGAYQVLGNDYLFIANF
jgi:hypothetical protein